MAQRPEKADEMSAAPFSPNNPLPPITPLTDIRHGQR